MKRVHRKTRRTLEEKGRLKAVRDTFQAERPSLDELVESGDYTEPVKHGVTLDALHIAALLKQAREEAHLSLADVSDRCGLDRSAISRLENGMYENRHRKKVIRPHDACPTDASERTWTTEVFRME
jgi:DNA-binding XRE family transcriptional regulator